MCGVFIFFMISFILYKKKYPSLIYYYNLQQHILSSFVRSVSRRGRDHDRAGEEERDRCGNPAGILDLVLVCVIVSSRFWESYCDVRQHYLSTTTTTFLPN